jgi:tRNA threonylcarbamoyladenosine biosynthesis protein TsaB
VKILALDTATELCSAALWLDGECLAREDARARASGERIMAMIAELLAQSGLTLTRLDAIAFGRGPGGFTGVRLATAVAQGLGFAAGLPLLPISDLRALAQRAFSQAGSPPRALVCQDARMQQVYWGCFECGEAGSADPGIARPVGIEAVADPQTVVLPARWLGSLVCGAGSGFEAFPALGLRADLPLTTIAGELRPRAWEIAVLAAADGLGRALPPEAAQPIYLRDEVAAPRS